MRRIFPGDEQRTTRWLVHIKVGSIPYGVAWLDGRPAVGKRLQLWTGEGRAECLIAVERIRDDGYVMCRRL